MNRSQYEQKIKSHSDASNKQAPAKALQEPQQTFKKNSSEKQDQSVIAN